MNTAQKLDSKLDPFFARHGKVWVQSVNIFCATGIPLAMLATVLFGTKKIGKDGFELTTYYLLPIYIALIAALFSRFTRKYERQLYRHTIACMAIAGVASLGVIILSLPGFPLASHWHAPSPSSNFTVLLPLEIGLLAGIAGTYYQSKRLNTKKLFS